MRRFLSLTFGVPLVIVIFTASLATTMLFRERSVEHAAIEEDSHAELAVLMNHFQLSIEYWLRHDDPVQVRAQVALAGAYANIDLVALIDESATVQAASSAEYVGRPFANAAPAWALSYAEFARHGAQLTTLSRGHVDFSADHSKLIGLYPIEASTDRSHSRRWIALVQYDLSLRKARADYASVRRIAEFSLYLVAFSGTLWFAFFFFLHRPLGRLVAAMGRFADGEHGVRAANEGPSELQRIAESFNRIAGRVETQVAELKISEAQAQRSQHELDTYFAAATDMLCIANTTHFLKLSPSWSRHLGYPLETLQGRPFVEFVHPDDRGKTLQNVADTQKGRNLIGFVNRYLHADGTYRWLEWSTDVRDGLYYSVARDITARRNVEAALHDTNERIQLLIERMPVGCAMLAGDDLHVEVWNPAMEAILGYTAADAATWTGLFPPFMGPEAIRQVAQVHPKLLAGEASSTAFLAECVTKDGRRLQCELSGTPLRHADGSLRGLVVLLQDVTERRRYEEALLNRQKMDAVALLAGGIAHDFNNLLMGVFGFVSLMRPKADEQTSMLLDEAEHALQQARALTQQLLTFAKGGAPIRKAHDLVPLARGALALGVSGTKARGELTCDEEPIVAFVDEGQFSQVIHNLVRNAAEAMPEGGTVAVRVGKVSIAHEEPNLHPGRYAVVRVHDTGTGIPPENLPRIFEPYFTTKRQGNGLGLATAFSIVRKHGGTIRVISWSGKGTTFEVYLPAAAAPEAPPPPPAATTGGRGRILLMEDEPTVARVCTEMLWSLGYKVDLAAHGDEAVALYRRALAAGAPYEAVLLDLTIKAGMGGKETLQALLALDPHVKAVVSSGYADDPVMADYRRHGFSAVLAKPYQRDELGRTLHSLLGPAV
jgi:PAS domain S-box-containing protein